jgi:uncharacterized cupredoxin-like copper-binding protein
MTFRLTTLAGAACALALATTLAVAAPGEPGHSHKTFAAGEPGDLKQPIARTMEVTMHETEDAKMLFSPNRVEVKRGEQVRFVLKNAGKVDHEFMLDSVANNAKHKIAMEKNPDMEHDDPNGRRLNPDGSSEVVWRFTKAGTFEFACLIPGHYESGMKGTVVVK